MAPSLGHEGCTYPNCPVHAEMESRVSEVEEAVLTKIIPTLGHPPDPSTQRLGAGMAGAFADMRKAIDELRAEIKDMRKEMGELKVAIIQHKSAPKNFVVTAGLVLTAVVPLVAGLVWIATHMRYAP